MTVLYLVRHGLTEHTGHRLSGRMPGIALNVAGTEQVEALATRLAKVSFKAIYSSPIQRTQETAAAIARAQGRDVVIRDDLMEVEYGRWTDRSIKSLMRTKLWTTVQRHPSGVRFPDGESLREVQNRALDALESIASEHRKGPVCVVSHGDVIRLALAHFLGVHLDLYQRIHVGAASVSVVGIGEGAPKVIAVNLPPDGALR